jgi:hypothetical protein
MRMWTALHTIWWPNEDEVLAPCPNWTSSGHIRGCGVGPKLEDGPSLLIYLCYYAKQSIKYIWSLAAVGVDVDSSIYDMVAQ